ncbi:MAG: AAA family ATPase [Patescibacteria group bacterium]
MEEDIAEVISRTAGIPVNKIVETESEKLKTMEEKLHLRIISQNEAIIAVSNAIRRNRAGLKDANRPIGSFIFLGPTGVGKTELAKALAEFLFDDETKIIRLDMSEYMEKHSVSKMIGSPPGYIGYDEGGQLTERVRRAPYSIVLLDEMEKAHEDVFNILLQIFDEGHLTDSQGVEVSFKNCIIISTSNLGSSHIFDIDKNRIGFSEKTGKHDNYELIKEKIIEEEAILGVDILIIATDWPQFRELINVIKNNLSKGAIIMDGRRILQHKYEELAEAGYNIIAVGSQVIKAL